MSRNIGGIQNAIRTTSRRNVGGFTLAEILVALALVALLAAVLLPTVAGQILKGDAGRVMQDIEAVRAGIDQFVADVHRYPGKYSDLSKAITTAGTDINGNTYTTGLVSKWAGPYVTKDTITAVVLTGYGGSILNTFKTVANTNGVNYVTILVAGIAQTDFNRIDTQVDGSADAVKGLLRWVTGGGGGVPDTVKYLATPIQ